RGLFACPFRRSVAQKSILHLNQAFACLGVPREIKTDNGPNYRSQAFRHFLQTWGVRHTFGIPLNSTKQVIVERAHKTLKAQLTRLREGGERGSPEVLVDKALVVLNHISFANPQSISPIQNHF
ncbi:transposase family protein, partial [Klebsiella pneumoniae]|nr:transposase family protein [Klebsiella pneumoniae]